MHENVESHELREMAANVEGLIEGAATGSPGDINPKWICGSHSTDSLNKILLTCIMKTELENKLVLYLPAGVFGGKYS